MERGRRGREQRPCGVPRGGGSAVPLVWGEEELRAPEASPGWRREEGRGQPQPPGRRLPQHRGGAREKFWGAKGGHRRCLGSGDLTARGVGCPAAGGAGGASCPLGSVGFRRKGAKRRREVGQ